MMPGNPSLNSGGQGAQELCPGRSEGRQADKSVHEDKVLRSERSNSSASSIFLRISGSPLSSASAVQGTRFIASTAVSRSPANPPLDFMGLGARRRLAELKIAALTQKMLARHRVGQDCAQLSQILGVRDALLVDLFDNSVNHAGRQ